MAYLGYRGDDADTDYGRFFEPRMAALPGHVVDALHHGPQADQVLLEFSCADTLLDDGHHQTETGYGRLRDGGFTVSVRTDMPGVTPKMWGATGTTSGARRWSRSTSARGTRRRRSASCLLTR